METIAVICIVVFAGFAYLWSRGTPDSAVQIHFPREPESQPTIAPASPWPSGTSMLPEKFIVLDLETTGLDPDEDEIIEVGAIRVILGSDTRDAFHAFIRPDKKVPQRITEITGITQEIVDCKGRHPAVVLNDFISFIQDSPLVTFNAPFDMGFLHNAARRHGLLLRNRYTCALKMARRAWPGLPSYRLAYLAKLRGLPANDTHRALGDCKRTEAIFVLAASEIGEKIHWDVDWHVMVEYNEARDANRSFCIETRPLEISDPVLAISRYSAALSRMYEYEKLVDYQWADCHILDRLTLCLWKLARYDELVKSVDDFVDQFPDTRSSLMVAILKRREKAVNKSIPAAP